MRLRYGIEQNKRKDISKFHYLCARKKMKKKKKEMR